MDGAAQATRARQLPLEQLELIRKLVGKRSSPPRRPAATERRFAVELIPGRRGTDLGRL